MGFFLFLLATAALLIRPSEQIPELRSVNLYQMLIIPCVLFSIGTILEQFTLGNLETRPISVCVFGLLIAVVLSHVANGNSAQAADTGIEFGKVLVYYVLLVGNITTVARLRVYLYCLGFFAIAFLTVAVLQYQEVIPTAEADPMLTATAPKTQGSEGQIGAFVKEMDYDQVTGQMVEIKRLRGTGIFRDPNDLCLLITMGIFIALYGFTDPRVGVMRMLWLLPLLFFAYCMSLTQSRGGFLSLLSGFVVLFYARFGWRATLAICCPLIVLAVALVGGRMASFSATEGTGQTRIQIWSDSIAALIGSPVFGIGMNEMSSIVGKVAHNSFLHAYTELGVFGGTLFFGAFFIAGWTLLRLVLQRQWLGESELGRTLPFLLAILAAFVVGILSLSRVDTVPTYLLLGLVTAVSTMAAGQVPALALKFDSGLVQRMAMASIAFLGMCYVFVMVFKV